MEINRDELMGGLQDLIDELQFCLDNLEDGHDLEVVLDELEGQSGTVESMLTRCGRSTFTEAVGNAISEAYHKED